MMNNNYIVVPVVMASSIIKELMNDSSDIEILEELRRKQNSNKCNRKILPKPKTTSFNTDLINPLMVEKTNNNNNYISIKPKMTKEVTSKNIEREITQTVKSEPFFADTSAIIADTVQKSTISNDIRRASKRKRSILHPIIRNSNNNVKDISVNQFIKQEPKRFVMDNTTDLTEDSKEFYQPPDKKILIAKPKMQNLPSTNKYIIKIPKQGMVQYICTNSNLVMNYTDIQKNTIGYCRPCALFQNISMTHHLCKDCNLELECKCLKCERLFFAWSKFMNHLTLKGTVITNVYKCKYCSFTSFVNNNVKQHITLAHKEIVPSK